MTEPKSPSQPPSRLLPERIDALEIRIAYLDEIIETLNTTITAQWKQIDALSREMLHLRERLDDAEMKSGTGPSSEPPPHY